MIGGFFGAILGFLAAVPVTFGNAAVMYQLCLNDGGVYKDYCGLTLSGSPFIIFCGSRWSQRSSASSSA